MIFWVLVIRVPPRIERRGGEFFSHYDGARTMVDFMEGGQGMGAKGFQCLEMRDIDWVMGKNCSELTACDGRKSSFEGGVGRGCGWVFCDFSGTWCPG